MASSEVLYLELAMSFIHLSNPLGAIHKGRPSTRGRGFWGNRTNSDIGGGGVYVVRTSGSAYCNKKKFYSGPTLDCLLYSVSSITRYCIGNLLLPG